MKNRKIIIPVLIVFLLILVISVYFGVRAMANTSNVQLKASGTIQAVDVNISSELAGKVTEVMVSEGQVVKLGDPLLHMDDSLLQEEVKVAAAGLDSAKASELIAENTLNIAQAQYQITLETALENDKQFRLQDWFSNQKQFNQPYWYFTRTEQVQVAQSQVDAARNGLKEAESNLTDVTKSLDKSDFLAAELHLLNARQAYLISKDVNTQAQNSTTKDSPIGVYNLTHCGTNQGYHLENSVLTNQVYGCSGDYHLAAAGQALYNHAQEELSSAQDAYNKLLTTQAADEVLQARAVVSVAQEMYYSALDHLRALQTGDQSPSVAAAQEVVNQAQAGYNQSQKAAAQAQANIDLLNSEISKSIVTAPMDGVILTRSIEPGEFVQPGQPALTLGDISQLSITVYVPEDRYGQVSIGETATVKVDSFPALTFIAKVTNISDQAQFTPRNVQTVEGRSSTVYAVKLVVSDRQGKLKPGMPADVVFQK